MADQKSGRVQYVECYKCGAENECVCPTCESQTARIAELTEALRELVRLKDIKDGMDAEWKRGSDDEPKQWTNEQWRTTEADYQCRKPLAWEAARRALASAEQRG